MRISDQKLNPSLKNQIIKALAETFSDLKTPQTAEQFLKNFFNDNELETFAKRLAVAYWLKKGRSYSNIKLNLKVSSATVASIQNEIDKPGFKLALKNLEADEWANVWSEKIKKFIK